MPSPAGWAIADIASLKNIGTDVRSTGYVRLVVSKKAWYIFIETATDTADDDAIVAPTTGNGRWFRVISTVTSNSVLGLEEYIEDVLAGTLNNDGDIFFNYNDTAGTITSLIKPGVIVDADISNSASIAQNKIANLTADLNNKANISHIHTASDVSNFSESVDDRIAALLQAGSNVSLIYDDNVNTLTINVDIDSSLNETIDDRVATFLAAGTNISLDYNDANNTLTISATGAGGSSFGGSWDDIEEEDWDILYSS